MAADFLSSLLPFDFIIKEITTINDNAVCDRLSFRATLNLACSDEKWPDVIHSISDIVSLKVKLIIL